MVIERLEDVKITKVKDWAVYFDVCEKHYILHGSEDDESYVTLFERTLDKFGHYELTPLKSILGDACLKNKYIAKQKDKTIVYSLVDVRYFVYTLTKKGFAEGLYSYEVELQNKRLLELRKELKFYDEKCDQIRNQIANLE